MYWRNTPERFGKLSIAMHWLMLLLLTAVYACIELRVYFPRGSDLREGLKTWHFMLGLSVLALVLVRLTIRLSGPTPRIQPATQSWQLHSAQLTHALLYVFMMVMPILGWLTLSGEGKAVPFFGLQLPALIGPDKVFADSVAEVHETIGTLGYWLIGLHAVAALIHHYLLRDNTLLRMLPPRKTRNPARVEMP